MPLGTLPDVAGQLHVRRAPHRFQFAVHVVAVQFTCNWIPPPRLALLAGRVRQPRPASVEINPRSEVRFVVNLLLLVVDSECQSPELFVDFRTLLVDVRDGTLPLRPHDLRCDESVLQCFGDMIRETAQRVPDLLALPPRERPVHEPVAVELCVSVVAVTDHPVLS